jgi:ACS family hexuronate transporter-like MFS transporter
LNAPSRPKPIRHLRWWIAGMLFFMAVINYIDRQTVNVLGPILKEEYRWDNEVFATVLISFRVAYAFMQSVNGRLLDLLGTRLGLSLSVAFYSIVQVLMTTVQGLIGFRVFRFLLGAGEAANNPGCTKAVSEWFPVKERAWAVAMFDAGSSVGGAVAPFVVLLFYHTVGNWRLTFLVTGSLGFVWLLIWRWLYYKPEEHPRISPEELALIQHGQPAVEKAGAALPNVKWHKLLFYRQTWGIISGRFLIDPYWFFIGDWFAVYLKSKGFSLEASMIGIWAPFLASDIGNFFGGGLSSYFIRRGWPVGRARRVVLLIFGPSMLLLIPAAFNSNYAVLLALFSYATFAYSACSTMFLSLPADVFHTRSVGSVSGLGGTAAGIGTLITTYLIGYVSDRFSFQPVVIVASILPCVAAILFVALVRAGKKPDPEGILLNF